jgi:transposase InsO family protein
VFAIVSALLGALVAAMRPRASLVVEILVLRQQLAVLKRRRSRPALRPIDRAFWVAVSRVWSRWADALAIVKPATVIGWHRRGFARFCAWKSRRIGRPPLSPEVVALIVQMARENPLWSRRRIANELAKLGHDVGKDAVAKYMPRPAERPSQPPSQTWGSFIRTHAVGTIAIDFFTVPTVTFGVLYAFFVLSLERRRVIHVNVTEHPTAEWAAQQIVEAVGPDEGLALLIRDRDKIFGAAFDRRVDNLGLTQLRIAPRSPWQNGFAERWVGTARREIVDHMIVLGEHHLRRILRAYIAYYKSASQYAPRYLVEIPSANCAVLCPPGSRYRAATCADDLSRSSRLKIQGPSGRGWTAATSPRSTARRRVFPSTHRYAAASVSLSQPPSRWPSAV